MNSELVLHLNLFVEATPDDSAIFFKNDDESPTVLTYNIIKYSVDRCVTKLPFLNALKKSYAVQMIHRNWIQYCHKASLFIYFQVQLGVV